MRPSLALVRRLELFIAGVVLALAAPGCMPAVGQTTYLVRIDQTAVVRAPTGPTAIGPMNPARHVSLEGSVDATTVFSRDDGANTQRAGHLVPVVGGRGRMALGITDAVEVGVDGSFSSVDVAAPNGPTVTAAPRPTGIPWGVGVQLRVRGGIAPRLRIGLDVEAGVDSVPRTQAIHEETTESWAASSGPPSSSATSHDSLRGDQRAFGHVRAGVHLAYTPSTNVELGAGALVQDAALYTQHGEGRGMCVFDGASFLGTCSGVRSPDDVSTMQTTAVGTAWLSASYRVGIVVLFAQAHWNALGPATIVQVSPVGGTAGLRVVF